MSKPITPARARRIIRGKPITKSLANGFAARGWEAHLPAVCERAAALFADNTGAGKALMTHLTQLLRELTALPPPKHAVWNVNFPGCGVSACKGILRDRRVAPAPLFREWFREEEQESVRTLTLTGVPLTAGDPVPAHSDLEALLEGYISVGIVECSVMSHT